jgi:hypothetical protein
LFFKSFRINHFVETPLIAGFVEIKHVPNTWAWSGKTTESQASPSDCYKIAKAISDEECQWATAHSCSMHL